MGIMFFYFLMRLLMGYRFWPVTLINDLLHLVLPLAFLVLAVALLSRAWGRVAAAGGLVALYVGLFGGLFVTLPSDAPSCEVATCLDLVSYNVGAGLVTPGALAAYVVDMDADLVGLQEVSSEQAKALQGEAVSAVYPYRVMYGLGADGRVLLSKYPIVAEEFVPSVSSREPTYLYSVVEVDSVQVDVLIMRYKPPRFVGGPPFTPYQTWVTETTLDELDELGPASIVFADLNTTDQGENYRDLRQLGYKDAFRVGGQGYGVTFPARVDGHRNFPEWLPPVVRIDYIFITDAFSVLYATTGKEEGSDHRPVFARVVLRE
jgi:endonuclease/exonuclease/phosphatase (EEP) superfamily protein YafD